MMPQTVCKPSFSVRPQLDFNVGILPTLYLAKAECETNRQLGLFIILTLERHKTKPSH